MLGLAIFSIPPSRVDMKMPRHTMIRVFHLLANCKS
jgi:hypothetical protein